MFCEDDFFIWPKTLESYSNFHHQFINNYLPIKVSMDFTNLNFLAITVNITKYMHFTTIMFKNPQHNHIFLHKPSNCEEHEASVTNNIE